MSERKVSKEAVVSDTQQGEREQIGRIMHESWSRTKRAQGFHGPNEPCKHYMGCCPKAPRLCPAHHADLIPWEVLPEKQKDINRHAFDAVLESGLFVSLARLREVERERDAIEDKFGVGGGAVLKMYRLRAERAESRLAQAGKELERFTALEANLPPGFAIGDDATAELAVEFAALKAQAGKLAEAARQMTDCQGVMQIRTDEGDAIPRCVCCDGEEGKHFDECHIEALRKSLLDFDSLASAPKISRR